MATNRLCEAQLSKGAEREAERGGSGSVLAVRPRAGSALLFYLRYFPSPFGVDSHLPRST